MKFNFETFSTKLKAIFDTMEKYGDGRFDQEKVSAFLEKISTVNHNLESETTFCRSNHNVKYLTATNYLDPKIRFIFPAHQPIQ